MLDFVSCSCEVVDARLLLWTFMECVTFSTEDADPQFVRGQSEGSLHVPKPPEWFSLKHS